MPLHSSTSTSTRGGREAESGWGRHWQCRLWRRRDAVADPFFCCRPQMWAKETEDVMVTEATGRAAADPAPRSAPQVCVNPTQVCVNPTPVCVNPTQVCVNPTPVYVTPTQVLRTAVRRPELHPDDAHFAGGFTVAVLSLELELQALLEASPSPPSKCSAPAHTPCWGLGAARVVQPHAPPSHHGHSAAAPSPHERLSTRSATLSLCAQRSVRIQAKFRAFFVTRLDRGTTKHTSQPEPLP